MTLTLTDVTQQIILSRSDGAFATNLGIICTMLLLTLLIKRELSRSSTKPGVRTAAAAFNIAIVPLSLAFLIIVAVRIIDLFS